ncbi:MAG TPA: hypothetical protein VGM99_03155 [Candidatus Cybelea sp.]
MFYPKTVFGPTRLLEVERLAARYEQASGSVESAIEAIDSERNDADLAALCARPKSDEILFLSPTTLTILSSPPRLQLSVQATLIRCADKRQTRSSQHTEIARAAFDDPSVLAGYKTLEVSVIRDLLPH